MPRNERSAIPSRDSREKRRKKVANRRRAREVAETVATNTGNIKDLKERRAPETAIRQVQNVPTEEVHISDSLSQTNNSASAAVYGSSKYGQSEYGGPHV